VTDGQDVVDKIAADAKPLDDNGTIAPEDQPVIESVKITD
jgi:peptidyl-prolyl cis-trans isomerase B (cyclophilin B)